MRKLRHIWRTSWVISLLLPLLLIGRRVTAVAPAFNNHHQEAQALFDKMSVEERVGQLFLVTFEGSTAAQQSDIADLITTYEVGGVMLLAENNNITEEPAELATLTADLQQLAITGSSSTTLTVPLIERLPTLPQPPQNPIPLLIAANYEGDNAPYNEIYTGLTAVPSNMAIGATWQPEYARTVGRTVGQELERSGINMLLGPVLDVLTHPDPASESDLGTRAFGGDPYWVGVMGEAYINGVHQGSGDRIAVIAKHFPGSGSGDRSIEQESPTIHKSLDDLLAVDLLPFTAVTHNTSNGRADGLLATHIRYQGFQGSINNSTPPISFDPQGMGALMELPAFAAWRSDGGLIVSDALGAHAIQQFYDDTGASFPHRQVAKDALLAGNDLLFLQNFALGNDKYETQLNNIQDTIIWFREKYRNDQLFQQRVDEAVLRILSLKLRLYDSDFGLESVLSTDNDNVYDGVSGVDVSQSAITLLSPSPEELAARFSTPPTGDDNIVIFTDMRYAKQCGGCTPQSYIGETALADAILSLYGPEASEQTNAEKISSYTFADLQQFLDAGDNAGLLPDLILPELEGADDSTPTAVSSPEPTAALPAAYRVNNALAEADWIIFALLGDDGQSAAIHHFLAERPDIIRNNRVIVFAYNAPYYLDSTEISKLTAYFGVYSKIDSFIEASVRALFLESPLIGHPPVDVEGINYTVATALEPDPDQTIELFITNAEGGMEAPPSEAPLQTAVGDTLRLQTAPITDHNGNIVPDGTMVRFMERDLVQGTENIIDTIPTKDGITALDYLLEERTSASTISIAAYAGETISSQEVLIKIADTNENAEVTVVTPEPSPTAVPTIPPSPTPEPTATPLPTIPPSPTPEPPAQEQGILIVLSQLQNLGMLFVGLGTVTGGITAVSRWRRWGVRRRVEGVLWVSLGALILYIYSMFDLPGTAVLPVEEYMLHFLAILIGGGVAGTLFIYRTK